MLLCVWFLPKYCGINSLIYAMGVCFTISAILNLKILKKEVCKTLTIKKYLIFYTIFLLPAIAITSFLTSILSNFIPLFFNLIISCLFGALFFVLLCIIFNIFNIKNIKEWISENNILKVKRTKKV